MTGKKRASIDAETERLPKQSKLSFGQKASSEQSTPQTQDGDSAATSYRQRMRKPGNQSKSSEASWTAPEQAEHGFTITDKVGDIFDAPDATIIIHACNTVGSWGAGIAAAFRSKYPGAYKVYQGHCKSHKPEELVGTALMIPPMEQDESKAKHWIGCLFTSRRFGRARDSPQQILEATTPSLVDLLKQMSGKEIVEMRICQINSGMFAVPWERSRAVIASIEIKAYSKIPEEIVVYSLPTSK